MLRLPDPEEPTVADAPPHRDAPPRREAPPAAAASAVVTDLSERRARNPLFRGQVPVGRSAPEGDDLRAGRRARRVVTAAGAQPGAERESAAPRDDAPVCATCPFGVAMMALDEVQPDARDHLLAASRELLAAARTVIESLEHTIERQQRTPTSARSVQHVRVRRA